MSKSKSEEPNIKSILIKLHEYNSENNVEKIIKTIEELKEIEIDGKKINLKDPIYDKYLKGYTLLYWICYYNLENLLDVLIDNYIDELDVDVKNEKSLHRSFHAVCMVGNLEMFKKLYFVYHKKKIEEDNEDDDEENDNKKKKININKYLATHDKKRHSLYNILNTTTWDHCNSFYFACRYNHLHMIKYFYNTIGKNNGLEEISKKINNYQETPLNAACKYNYIEVVKFLLENKLHRDINKGEIVKLRFVKEGKYKRPDPDKIYYKETDNNILDIVYFDVTPLHIATIYGNKEIIILLVKHGSNVYKEIRRSHIKSTPYTLLCDIIDFIDLKDKNNNSLLNKYDEVLQLFIKNGWTKYSSLYTDSYCRGKERIHYAKKGEEYKNPLHPRTPSKSPSSSKSPRSSKRSTSKKSPSKSKGGKTRKNQ